MRPFVSHFQTSVGRKILVALTGLGLIGYVIFHLLGNLQVFEGPQALNRYAAFLHEMPILLWAARLGLLGIVIIHMTLAVQLALHNGRARPVAYARHRYRQASLASRTMAVSGLVLFLFIVFHLLHLTGGVIDPFSPDRLDAEGHRDLFGRLMRTFQNPLIVAIYVAGQVALGLHVSHAVSSTVQTLGFEHAFLARLGRVAGPAVAGGVVLGNVTIVLAIFLGIVRP